ncbi:MAG TPA: VWA domain-containing protein [Gemmatimonadaceae bacterium]|nr:VWA domain-containing protein [Gemmatimonadaceae bacterium]
MHFADPWAFVLLLAVVADALRDRRPRQWVALPMVDTPSTPRARWARLPAWLRTAALALVVVALARPRIEGEIRETKMRGRNVMLALDISSSMKARDLGDASRIDLAKRVLASFVSRRPNDFLGLVVFAGRAFTQAPLTTDDAVVLDLLHRADIGLLPDGTAIGTALAMAELHLEDLPRGSGVIVLLTDGGNNTGAPDPLTAAAIARALGIRVYAVGVSSNKVSRSEIPASMGEAPSSLTTFEERLLQRIATTSGGRYYRAADNAALEHVMGEIDRLERTELTLREVLSYREMFWVPLALALLLLTASVALSETLLKGVP